MIKKIRTIATAVFLCAVPLAASAVTLLPACATLDGGCNTCALVALLINGVQFLLEIIGGIVLLAVIAGGFVWLTSGGNSSRIGTGKAIITSAFVGLLLFLSAYMIINFVMAALMGSDIDDVQIFNNDWSEYCGDLSNSTASVNCSEADDGTDCTPGDASVVGRQYCYSGSCVTGCVIAARSVGHDSGTCVATEEACGADGGYIDDSTEYCPLANIFCCPN